MKLRKSTNTNTNSTDSDKDYDSTEEEEHYLISFHIKGKVVFYSYNEESTAADNNDNNGVSIGSLTVQFIFDMTTTGIPMSWNTATLLIHPAHSHDNNDDCDCDDGMKDSCHVCYGRGILVCNIINNININRHHLEWNN